MWAWTPGACASNNTTSTAHTTTQHNQYCKCRCTQDDSKGGQHRWGLRRLGAGGGMYRGRDMSRSTRQPAWARARVGGPSRGEADGGPLRLTTTHTDAKKRRAAASRAASSAGSSASRAATRLATVARHSGGALQWGRKGGQAGGPACMHCMHLRNILPHRREPRHLQALHTCQPLHPSLTCQPAEAHPWSSRAAGGRRGGAAVPAPAKLTHRRSPT